MIDKHNVILTEDKIEKILERIAVQIVEHNFKEKDIVLIGIAGQGYKMAGILKNHIESDYPIRCLLFHLETDKTDPGRGEIKLDCNHHELKDKTIVLVDDVLNTGRTQAYALSYILKAAVKKVETAVLVNRRHTAFPLHATYTGIELSTTLDEHIEVKLEQEVGAYLY